MPRGLSIGAVLVLVSATTLAVREWVVFPYRCNWRVKQAAQSLARIDTLAGPTLRAAQLARDNVANLEPCVGASPQDISAVMVLAGSYRSLGLNSTAAALYRTALLYDRRPEIYFNLGETELAIGDARSALRNLIQACIYTPVYLDEIGKYHAEVKRAVDAYQTRLAESAKK